MRVRTQIKLMPGRVVSERITRAKENKRVQGDGNIERGGREGGERGRETPLKSESENGKLGRGCVMVGEG